MRAPRAATNLTVSGIVPDSEEDVVTDVVNRIHTPYKTVPLTDVRHSMMGLVLSFTCQFLNAVNKELSCTPTNVAELFAVAISCPVAVFNLH